MKSCNFLEDYLEEDVIGKIYHNDFHFVEQVPTSEEYIEILESMKEQERRLLLVEGFKEYMEDRNIKEGIEAEEQFKLGFKTAIRIIIESYHS